MRFFLLYLCCFLIVYSVSCKAGRRTVNPPLIISSTPNNLNLSIKDSLLLRDTLSPIFKDSVRLEDSVEVVKNAFYVDELTQQKQIGLYKQADFAPAMHYDLRRPNYVIIHHTSQNNVAQTLRTFQLPHTKVSAHYVIGKDGQIIQLLNDYERAWHAGKSKWGSLTDVNSASVGIELDNNGRDTFPDIQINSLLILLDTLKSKHMIPQLNFIGHADVAPTRKNDPNINFPWKKLAEKGFGIWYNEDYLLEPPVNFNPIDALKIMGYDMRNPEAAIEAFKRKYIKEENKILTDYDKKVLYDLYRKYY